MIDRHYGHLARDGREHAIRLLDELSVEQGHRGPGGRCVDTGREKRRQRRQQKRRLRREEQEAPLTDSNRRPLTFAASSGNAEHSGRCQD